MFGLFLPELRMRVRLPSPVPETLLMQLALRASHRKNFTQNPGFWTFAALSVRPAPMASGAIPIRFSSRGRCSYLRQCSARRLGLYEEFCLRLGEYLER